MTKSITASKIAINAIGKQRPAIVPTQNEKVAIPHTLNVRQFRSFLLMHFFCVITPPQLLYDIYYASCFQMLQGKLKNLKIKILVLI